MKIQKKIGRSGVEGGGGVGLGGQSGCDRRIEVFGKIKKKNKFGGRLVRGEGVRVGGSGWM